jgi:filamentous hemagglutinin family protein
LLYDIVTNVKIYRFCKLQIAPHLAISASIGSIGIAAFLNVSFQSAVSAQVIPDQTLGAESSSLDPNPNIKINGTPSNVIKGGATRGGNLFHSFETFNVGEGRGAYFDQPVGIQRILSRVTGKGISNRSEILGVLGVLGDADLFLINPNGIIFGPKASLDVKGSFIATTASNLILEDGTQFSAKESSNSSPLSVSIPVGLQFRETAGDIIQQASATILRGPAGKTLALVGGNVSVSGGRITIPLLAGKKGRLELGSVAGNGYVGLQPIQEGWALNYENVQDFNDIEISRDIKSNQRSSLVVLSGDIQIQARNLRINGGSQIQGFEGNIKVFASDAINISGFLARPNSLSIFSGLVNDAISDRDAGGITINTRRLVIQDGGRITTRSTGLNSTIATGNGGNLKVIASESVQLTGRPGEPTGLFSETRAFGAAGNISINTQNLTVQNGAAISAESKGDDGSGNSLATGAAGNIDINASGSLNLNGGFITTATNGLGGKAGDLEITTSRINISNGSKVTVSGREGQAGNLTIKANSLSLNRGSITAEIGKDGTESGGNIILQIRDLLSLENESLISATANSNAKGGNIKIDTPILLALSPTGFNGSDIIANAEFGKGGSISINSQGIFGIEQRKAIDGNQTNDIDASSQFGQSGQVQINTTTDPNQGLVELPATVVDPSTLVAQSPCKRASSSEFTRSGRGGLPPSLSQDLNGESTQVGLVEPANLSAAKQEPQAASTQVSSLPLSSSQIAPAKGWVYNDKGEVVLVAYNSAVTGPQRLQTASAGCPVF